MTTASLQTLHQALNRISPLSSETWLAIAALTSVRSVATGQHLLRAGEHALTILFVLHGLLREYYLDSHGRESTRRFCQAHEFSGSLADLLAGGPSAVSIEMLQAGEIIEVDWAALDALSAQHPSLMKLLRRIAEDLYVRKTRREFEMLTLPAAERYRRFALENPKLDAQLPRHLVASYLGVTAVHLSRVGAEQRRHNDQPKQE